MVRIKICGLTNLGDAQKAAELGADALGFIFYAGSPRCVSVEKAAAVIEALPPFVTKIGVFVEQSPAEINHICRSCRLDAAQLHGDQSPEFIKGLQVNYIKSFRLRGSADVEDMGKFTAASAFLLDTYVAGRVGGTGKTFNWRWARAAKKWGRPIILSGGLNEKNVAAAVKTVRPAAVDVSSGVESRPGRKNYASLARFIAAVRSAG